MRLGLDRSLPLCLLQWNSALAVNYPAREKFALKRGASFESIRDQSNGECISLHLPVVSTADLQKRIKNENGENSSVEDAYDREFNMTSEMKRETFLREKNKMRHSGEGKASLDRYRLASARIFDVMLESLETHVGKGNFILEKASIDELFLDVTKHCYRFNVPAWNDQNNCKLVEDLASKETVICAEHKFQITSDESIDDDIRALRRGCIIARGLRKSVFDGLGFTLSAGVADTKLVSKLCASYGKPNGQAVVFPPAISSVSI